MKNRTRKQHGGYNMPLSYFVNGANMRGTMGEATGAVGESGNWVRAPLSQTGGLRRSQKGGFGPAVMGAFAANGARLIPLAGYLGYNMYKNAKKTRKVKKTRKARKTRKGRAPRT